MSPSPLRARTTSFLAAAALAGAGGGAAAATSLSGSTTAPAGPATTVVQQAQAVASTASAASIYRAAAPSVVAVTAAGTGSGTGFVVDADGLIATNAHVVDGATSISVTLADGRRRTAALVGKDDSSDVALLRISAGGLKALRFADSGQVAVGDPVYAIGNPFGLDRTLTTGVVSALNRDITAPNGFAIGGALQTDAALNPGNSGGPLLDAAGRVVGINSQIESSSGDGSSTGGNTGIGFAVPATIVQRVVATLSEGGTVRHGYLGVSSGDATGGGAEVGAVTAGGPAADAGLRAGDVVVKVGTTGVKDSAALGVAVDRLAPGTRTTLRVRRASGTTSVEVTVGSRPAQAQG